MKPFCAICTAVVDERDVVLRPLGRDDAMVRVCPACDGGEIIARDSERGYEPPGSFLGFADAVRDFERSMGANKSSGSHVVRGVTRSPCHLLIRVAVRGPGGCKRDIAEARATFADQPWAADVRYLTTTGGEGRHSKSWHLFERPDPAHVARVRAPAGNPLTGLERFRRGKP